MKMNLLVLACLLLTVWLAPPVRGGETIVVTTSLLQDVVERLLPEDSGLQVFRLIPPGACPGHFDLQPSVRYALVNARLLFRHEFQEALAGKLLRISRNELVDVVVTTQTSLLVPENYLNSTRVIARELTACYPEMRLPVAQALQDVAQAVEKIQLQAKEQSRSWQDVPVIAAEHQHAFADWLGFRVIAVLERPENLTPKDLARYYELSPKLIIGNLQEGDAAARHLEERLRVPSVVLSNFPGADGFGNGYFELFTQNLARIARKLPTHD